jgi:uncharacterized protein
MLAVIDTNVIVSGLLKETGNPSKILNLAISNQFRIAYDNRILGEYEDVLSRKEFKISPVKANSVITYIELAGFFVEVENPISSDDFLDPKDMPFVEVFLDSHAQALVTGNIRHFLPLIEKGFSVMTPTHFIENFYPNQ